MTWLRKLFFNIYYLGNPPWDTGITPPELVEFIDTQPPGRALDLGCGTGTNALALAAAGWDTSGVDFSGRAIRLAKKKARETGLQAAFFKDDVLRLKDINGKFDLIYDIGCFHSLPPERFHDYAQNLSAFLAPGGTFMLYVFFHHPDSGTPGITQAELDSTFSSLKLVKREAGKDRGERRSAWLWFGKKTETG